MKIKTIISKIYLQIQKKRFELAIANIAKTKPINYKQETSVTIVTMLGHNTVLMYLVAIKSFMHHFGYGTIEVINDGSLTDEDIELLNHHIPGITYSNANEVDTLSCPSYISWKRVLRIAELAKQSYVIQLDSDTVSLAPLIDIHDKVQSNEGFLIGSDRWKQGVDVNFLHHIVSHWNTSHVQPSAEKIFHEIEFFNDGTKYLRGCAGFAGYPKNFATPAEIESLSRQIEEKIGSKWHEWGSEQTATLCLISKTRNASILPWPKYQNFMFPKANEPIESASFIHFLGTNRYNQNSYLKLVKKFNENNN